MTRPIRVLVVEDNPGDADLTCDTLEDSRRRFEISVVADGVQATDFLLQRGGYQHSVAPDFVLLDLNLPRMDGYAVLAEIQRHPALRAIPVVVWSSSDAGQDIARCYALGARCYVTKPVDLVAYQARLHAIEQFWFDTAKLP